MAKKGSYSKGAPIPIKAGTTLMKVDQRTGRPIKWVKFTTDAKATLVYSFFTASSYLRVYTGENQGYYTRP